LRFCILAGNNANAIRKVMQYRLQLAPPPATAKKDATQPAENENEILIVDEE
jgi:hypothetical protein